MENPDLRRDQIGNRRSVGVAGPCPTERRRQELLAVQYLKNAIIANTPREVDAIADHVVRRGTARQLVGSFGMLVGGDRAVKRSRHRSSSIRLPARQAEGADVSRGRRT